MYGYLFVLRKLSNCQVIKEKNNCKNNLEKDDRIQNK